MSAEDYLASGDKPKRNKYGAKKVTVDGHRFDSMAEGARYWDLKVLQEAGEISDLELQPEYPCLVQGVKVGAYRADFRYRDAAGKLVVEDVKGKRTDLYRWKKKHVEAQYGITVVEIVRGKVAA